MPGYHGIEKLFLSSKHFIAMAFKVMSNNLYFIYLFYLINGHIVM